MVHIVNVSLHLSPSSLKLKNEKWRNKGCLFAEEKRRYFSQVSSGGGKAVVSSSAINEKMVRTAPFIAFPPPNILEFYKN